ncbi:MAG: PD-(D/E)XK nuclease family protein [Schleiferiaceae bacterium]|nr:PD-(D/E)XK nuclease family protein [Schleiferiaceae bacterium]
MTFLETVAKQLLAEYGTDLKDVLILLPSKRADQFLRKALAAQIDTPIVAPDIQSVASFVTHVSQLQELQRLDLLFAFFEYYQATMGEGAEDFVGVMKWAPRMLQDFNEIDRHLVAAEKLFPYLYELEMLRHWAPDRPYEAFTDLMQRYIDFVKEAGEHYFQFREFLLTRNQGYQGMAYRKVAEQLDPLVTEWVKRHKVKKIIAVGLNALNTCEEKLFDYLKKQELLDFIWDADAYYLNDDMAEAGKFLRQYRKRWHTKDQPFGLVSRNFSMQEKHIEIIAVPSNTAQARAAANAISKVPAADIVEKRVALVLAEEALLSPILNAMPEHVQALNITMGYPVGMHPLANLLLLGLRLHELASGQLKSKNRYAFYHKELFSFLEHPALLGLLASAELDQYTFAIRKLKALNKVYFYSDDLPQFLDQFPLFSSGLADFFAATQAFEVTQSLGALLQHYEKNKNATAIDTEVAFGLFGVLNRLSELLSSHQFLNDFKSLNILFSDLLHEVTLDFYGEPMQGLQIMGVLETRALDFDHLILTSVNEGTLPSGKTDFSMIPFDVKRSFGMPNYLDKDAIYAYHFYRMLQRASHITLIYSTVDGSTGKSESSRFIKQLRYELRSFANIKITEKQFDAPVSIEHLRKLPTVTKTEAVLESLYKKFQTGLSPTSLTRYIADPVSFYKTELLGIREERGIEESIFHDTMGSAVHHVLEGFYSTYVNGFPTPQDYTVFLNTATALLTEQFAKDYPNGDMTMGRNLMVFKVAEHMLQSYIKNKIKNPAKDRRIHSIEDRFETEMVLSGIPVPVRFKGFADRVDYWKGNLQILDFKTGMFAKSDITFNSIEELFTPKKGKALQLMIYAWLLSKTYEGTSFSAGIVPLRESGGPVYPLLYNKSEMISKDDLVAFEEALVAQLLTMVDGDLWEAVL